jgi:hypothetical protein
VDLVAALFRTIWGAEPGRLPYLTRPSFYGEILCCWRARWIVGSKGSPMHAYTWYVWWKTTRSGPSLKIRISKDPRSPGIRRAWLDAAKKLAADMAGEMKQFYMVMGEFDFVAICEGTGRRRHGSLSSAARGLKWTPISGPEARARLA